MNRAAISTVFRQQATYRYLYCAGVLFLVAFYYLRWPIVAYDADLWRYLNYARHLFEKGEILHDSRYTFIVPPREFVNYSWLFQALVYVLFKSAGYYGLILLRTAVFLTTICFIWLFIRQTQAGIKGPLLATLCLLILVDRGSDIRPYMFSYLFSIIFLYIITFRPEKAFLLPAVAVAWYNFHGIEYPILYLIALAYLLDRFVHRLKRRIRFTGKELIPIVSLTVAMGLIFFTPYSSDLVSLPLQSTQYTALYVGEHARLSFSNLLNFHFSGFVPSYQTLYNIFLITAGYLFLMRLIRRKIQLYQAVLFLGGLFLALQGIRFINEFVILALPVLQTTDYGRTEYPKTQKHNFPVIILYACLMTLSLLYLDRLMGNRPKYPLSQAGLPHGVTQFLKQIQKKSTVLNRPVSGGYVQWQLAPDYKIYMDLHVPHFFTDHEFYIAISALYNQAALQKYIARYRPGFIMVPRTGHHRKLMQEFKSYVAVFFDDEEVLYVDKYQFPEVVRAYQLHAVDPYMLHAININALSRTQRQELHAALIQIDKIYPHGRWSNRALGLLHKKAKRYGQAMSVAQKLCVDFPNQPEGFRLKADILLAQGAYARALTLYQRAAKRMSFTQRTPVYRQMWRCYTALQQHAKAYNIQRKAVNMFSPHAGYQDLWRLAFSALQIGKTDEALMLIQFAALKVPEGDKHWKSRIQSQLSLLGKMN